MQLKDAAYYNGVIAPIAEMTVPMNDRACFLGDGIYDATAVKNHVAMDLDEHIERIFQSARLVRIDPPMDRGEMKKILSNMVSLVESPDQFLYWQITRGVGPRNHLFRYAGERASFWAFSRPHTLPDVYQNYSVITREDTRFFHCNVKTIDLLPSVLAAQAAEEAGCRETIFHRSGRVTECAHSNVHILRDGRLITAPLDCLILPGIARANILKLCVRLGIPVEERPYDLEELLAADEIFFSASDSPTMRVNCVDGQPVGMKDPDTFFRLRDAYQEEIRRKCGEA